MLCRSWPWRKELGQRRAAGVEQVLAFYTESHRGTSDTSYIIIVVHPSYIGSTDFKETKPNAHYAERRPPATAGGEDEGERRKEGGTKGRDAPGGGEPASRGAGRHPPPTNRERRQRLYPPGCPATQVLQPAPCSRTLQPTLEHSYARQLCLPPHKKRVVENSQEGKVRATVARAKRWTHIQGT